MLLTSRKCILIAFTVSLFLNGCAPPKAALEEKAVGKILKEDLSQIYNQDGTENVLTLEDALARGIKYNLDSKVAEIEELIASDDLSLERLSALPSIVGKLNAIGRNNPGASRSLSILSGTTSVEPSISTEQWRTTANIDLNWNLLEVALSVARSKSAADRELIATERRRKIFHNVVQDVYSAYWRAAAAQTARKMLGDLIANLNIEIEKTEKALQAGLVPMGDARNLKSGLLEKRRQLMSLQDQMLLSEIELKTLIALPPKADITLKLPEDWTAKSTLPRMDKDVESLEKIALLNRPEVHEEFMNRQIAIRNVRMALFETFPGADIALSYNRDKNQFLTNQEWFSVTGALVQSLTKILTLPARHKRAKDDKTLADKRRQALVAAVITQVHVADRRYRFYKEYYDAALEADANTQKIALRARHFEKAGMVSKAEKVNAEVDAGISEINKLLSYAQTQETYGLLLNTLGLDLWGNASGMDVPELAVELKRNLESFENAVLRQEDEPLPAQEPVKEAAPS